MLAPVAQPVIDQATAARELLRRRRARTSLLDYALAIDIPGAPASEDPDEALFHPIETQLVLHHRVILEHVQRCMETPRGRLMIFAPPGSAKSTYASVVAPTWALGRWPGFRFILTSYATQIARKQSRRARQICRSLAYRSLWSPYVTLDDQGVEDWTLSNGSELMAAGLMAGITGNRADGAVIDDPVAGREEADSETIRDKTWDGYIDDLTTRLKPLAWLILIQTRWHEDDLAGRLLPADYKGQSGPVRCQDGAVWEILNIPAKAENPDDPLGRKPGEYLWPQWFPREHWALYEDNPLMSRTWSALFQQRPVGVGTGDFTRDMFHFYEPQELPEHLRYYGASDYNVTTPKGKQSVSRQPDYSEHGVFGMDDTGDLWGVAWWSKQCATDISIDAFLDLVEAWHPVTWWNEGGVIDKAVAPAIRRRMKERQTYVHLEQLPSMQDKRAKLQSFQARASAGTIHLPKGQVWAERLVEQLVGLGAVRFDDMADVCGLIGRGVDRMLEAREPEKERPRGIKPFTEEWLEHDDAAPPSVRYR